MRRLFIDWGGAELEDGGWGGWGFSFRLLPGSHGSITGRKCPAAQCATVQCDYWFPQGLYFCLATSHNGLFAFVFLSNWESVYRTGFLLAAVAWVVEGSGGVAGSIPDPAVAEPFLTLPNKRPTEWLTFLVSSQCLTGRMQNLRCEVL